MTTIQDTVDILKKIFAYLRLEIKTAIVEHGVDQSLSLLQTFSFERSSTKEVEFFFVSPLAERTINHRIWIVLMDVINA